MADILKNHLENCFTLAESRQSKISDEIKNIDGMSGEVTRHFYNNLLNMDDARYLEIGTWKGSTVCAAMYGNKGTVTCIDNWSEFGGPKWEFIQNFEKFKGQNNAKFIEQDCFHVSPSELGKFNIYMYDGNHAAQSHYRALTHFIESLDDVFIYIVDDWNTDHIRSATRQAINDLKLKILWEREIRLTFDNSHTELNLARSSWWNGIFVALIKK